MKTVCKAGVKLPFYKAASEAYYTESVLYKNGLTNDLQLALYLFAGAETGMSVAYVNVWQSLPQSAASGTLICF
jgi:hypothetical protein